MMDHPSSEQLELYVLGAVAAPDSVGIRAHLETCVACSTAALDELDLDGALAQVADASRFCVACDRLADADRCSYCGTALQVRDYRIAEVRVQNAHGRLYRAIDSKGGEVALKELCFHTPPSDATLEAFEREARFLRALDHPRLPKFIASFTEGTGNQARLYLAQEFVAGESLESTLAKHYFTEGEILDIAQQVLDVLVYLQSLAPMVFHRDVKPANLIRRPDGSIALVDFGAARDDSATHGTTQIGTFGYMPIEQLAGIVDATTDGYALGASLLHLLARRPPWQLLDDGFPKRINVSAGAKKFLSRLTARKPEDRFVDARWALHALRAVMYPPRRRAVLPLLITVGTLAGGAYAGYEVRAYQLERANEAREEASHAREQAERALADAERMHAIDAGRREIATDLRAKLPPACTTERCSLWVDTDTRLVETGELARPVRSPELTVEAWLKPQRQIELRWPNALAIALSDDRVRASVFPGTPGNGELVVAEPNGLAWHHVALVYEQTSVVLYLDGRRVGVKDCAGCRAPELELGLAIEGSGFVDELHVWQTARTADQVRADARPVARRDTTGLVTYFNFNGDLRTSRMDAMHNNRSFTSMNDAYLAADVPF